MKFAKVLLLPALALIFSACSGYHVGSSLPKSVKTVSLLIINKTDEPSIEVAVQKALRAELQMDGRLEVRSAEVADTVLKVTLTSYELTPLAYKRHQGSLADEYRVTMTASTVFSDAESNVVLQETPVVQGEQDFPYTSDLTSTKRSALPGAAQDLARKIVSVTVAGW